MTRARHHLGAHPSHEPTFPRFAFRTPAAPTPDHRLMRCAIHHLVRRLGLFERSTPCLMPTLGYLSDLRLVRDQCGNGTNISTAKNESLKMLFSVLVFCQGLPWWSMKCAPRVGHENSGAFRTCTHALVERFSLQRFSNSPGVK